MCSKRFVRYLVGMWALILSIAASDNVDSEGMYNNVNVLTIDDQHRLKVHKTADLKHFFSAAPHQAHKKPHSFWVLCRYLFSFSNYEYLFLSSNGTGCVKKEGLLLHDGSTLRRHMAYLYPVRYFFSFLVNFAHILIQQAYRKWCKDSGFESMLPEDAKAHRTKQLESIQKQTAIDDHFLVQNPDQKPKPYSDSLFEEGAIQWLVETDQVSP